MLLQSPHAFHSLKAQQTGTTNVEKNNRSNSLLLLIVKEDAIYATEKHNCTADAMFQQNENVKQSKKIHTCITYIL